MDKPIVFISHRHGDKVIADTVKKHLLEWGVSNADIFQSSDPRRTATGGVNLSEFLSSKLENTNLLILIYTYGDEDWAYPMWECGVAQGKNTANTRLVVFQCTADEPAPFRGQKLINIGAGVDAIRSFAEDFHKTPGFIPPKDLSNSPNKGFSSNTPESVIFERAKRFYNDLQGVLPGAREDKHLWDFIRLRLEPESVEEIRQLSKSNDKEKVRLVLENNLELRRPKYVGIGYNVNTAVRQFGYAGYEDGLKFSDLINRWRNLDETKRIDWIDDLYDTIYRAVANMQPPTVSHPFKSVREGVDWWFFAPVTRIRVNRDNSREFDVYLIRSPSS